MLAIVGLAVVDERLSVVRLAVVDERLALVVHVRYLRMGVLLAA